MKKSPDHSPQSDKRMGLSVGIFGTLSPKAVNVVNEVLGNPIGQTLFIKDILKLNPFPKRLRGIRKGLRATQDELRRRGFTYNDGVFMSQEIPPF